MSRLYHLTINGRPLCVHTACLAGMQDRDDVEDTTRRPVRCGYGEYDEEYMLTAANAWAKAHPSHFVCVVLKPCPEVGG